MKCFNKEKYYETYREKQRRNNKVEFFKGMPKSQERIDNLHPELVLKYNSERLKSVEYRIASVKASAKVRGIEFAECDLEAFKSKILHCCQYCGWKKSKCSQWT